MSGWRAAERVAIARHGGRPGVAEYIEGLFTDFFEQRGDRQSREDPSILGGIALMAALVAATMWLWNALIPEIIGWKSIDYWQALGLLVLTHLVFGHFGRPTRHDERHHMHEMMRGMSHEEKREFIRRKMRNLCDRERQEDGTTAE